MNSNSNADENKNTYKKYSEHQKNEGNDETIKLSKNGMNFSSKIELLGLKALNILYKENNCNILISPLSIFNAMLMLMKGTAGQTRQEINDALDVKNLDIDVFKDINKRVESGDKDVLLKTANSLWVKRDLALKELYVKSLKDYFHADVKHLVNSEEVDKWITNKTEGSIEMIADHTDLNLVLLILNVIYFNGKWNEPFDPETTIKDSFYLNNNENVEASFMQKKGRFVYGNTKHYESIRLMYSNEKYYMDILFPKEGVTISDLLVKFKKEQTIKSGFQPEQRKYGLLKLPKFLCETDISLLELFKDLGIRKVFDQQEADFTNMAEKGTSLTVDEIKHKVFLKVDEAGTKAAAVSSVEFRNYPEEFHMHVNHPFLIQIKEAKTGIPILFGCIVNPQSD